jgi:tRNA (Thr-GGU) A37 N-methylase
MENNSIQYRPIGVIHSPYQNLVGMPNQPSGAKGVRGKLSDDRFLK